MTGAVMHRQFGPVTAEVAWPGPWALSVNGIHLHFGLQRAELHQLEVFWKGQPCPAQPHILDALRWLRDPTGGGQAGDGRAWHPMLDGACGHLGAETSAPVAPFDIPL